MTLLPHLMTTDIKTIDFEGNKCYITTQNSTYLVEEVAQEDGIPLTYLTV